MTSILNGRKLLIESKHVKYSSLSEVCEDEALKREIGKEEIAKCIQRLKIVRRVVMLA